MNQILARGVPKIMILGRGIIFSLFWILCGYSPLHANELSQSDTNNRASALNFKESSLKQIIWELERTFAIDFMYNIDEVAMSKLMTIDATNMKLDEILSAILQPNLLTYKKVNDTIVIVKDRSKSIKSRVVRGVVFDETGATLPGVTVMVQGTTLGVVTDLDGSFELEITGMEAPVFIFSFIGMESQTIKIINDSQLKIVMKNDTQQLEGVVVTGIFRRSKELSTGASVSYG